MHPRAPWPWPVCPASWPRGDGPRAPTEGRSRFLEPWRAWSCHLGFSRSRRGRSKSAHTWHGLGVSEQRGGAETFLSPLPCKVVSYYLDQEGQGKPWQECRLQGRGPGKRAGSCTALQCEGTQTASMLSLRTGRQRERTPGWNRWGRGAPAAVPPFPVLNAWFRLPSLSLPGVGVVSQAQGLRESGPQWLLDPDLVHTQGVLTPLRGWEGRVYQSAWESWGCGGQS